MWKEILVSPEWVDRAVAYWEDLNDILDNCEENFEGAAMMNPGFSLGVPFQEWECNYCQYYSICPSNLAKRRTGWVNG